VALVHFVVYSYVAVVLNGVRCAFAEREEYEIKEVRVRIR